MSLDTPFTSSGLTDPSITLKRGKVEISIKNATTIVQRMEELFPKNKGYGYSWTPAQEANYQHDKNKALVVAAKNWFKQELYGTHADDFDIVISENELPMQDTSDKQTTPFEEDKKSVILPCPPLMPIVEKTVNKNAYEIRTDVLAMALDFVKFKKETTNQLNSLTDEDVLSTANKFYKFVENRR